MAKKTKKKQKIKNLPIIIAILVIVIVIIGIIIAIPKNNKGDTIFDTVSKRESNNIIKKDVDVTFGMYTRVGSEENDQYEIEYTIKNTSKKNINVSLEFVAQNKKGETLAHGIISEDSLASGEEKTSMTTMVMINGSEDDLKKATYVLTRAYEEKE